MVHGNWMNRINTLSGLTGSTENGDTAGPDGTCEIDYSL